MKVYILSVLNKDHYGYHIIGVYLTEEEARAQRDVIWIGRDDTPDYDQDTSIAYAEDHIIQDDIDPTSHWEVDEPCVYYIDEIELRVTDPMQQLALRILEGDLVALDIAQDVLARG